MPQATSCTKCKIGKYTRISGSASCTACGAGTYGIALGGCQKCPLGYARSEENSLDLTSCIVCKVGETTNVLGATSCSSCDLGKYGNISRHCANCPVATYQDTRGQQNCKECTDGRVPNKAQTACEVPPWKIPSDCDFGAQYFNDTSSDPHDWRCEDCPSGASCTKGNNVCTLAEMQAKAGFWRVPWSEHNITFEKCPFSNDCLGVGSSSSSSDSR